MNDSPDLILKQSDWILFTKLNPPPILSDILDRPQLIARLENDNQRALTLISAPAGYGKSTLVAQWLESSSQPGAWISLDESDNNTRTFLSYIVAAVRRLYPKSCSRVHDILGASQLPPPNILATLLANDLEEVTEPFLLVLDDYHWITEPIIHDLLNLLLQHPPRCLHLVIISRRDPPLSLVSLKAKGLSKEIREIHLQFNAVETDLILKLVGNIQLDHEDLDQVMDDIEGWITGLRLLCLAMEHGDDPRVYLFGMNGGAAHVEDYLVEQVLSRQVPELQECLLKTSILDRFCAPLCEAVCGDGEIRDDMSGQRFMETIVEAKLFGVQLEPGGKWIRYHHLFQNLLQNHLERKWAPETIAALHLRAAQWFEGKGLTDEALKHAFAAGDAAYAADIIEGARMNAINQDKWAQLEGWLNSLPPGMEHSRSQLLISRAYLFVHSIRRIHELPALINRVVVLEGQSPADPMLAGELHLFQGVPLLYQGDIESAKEHFDKVLSLLPETNEEARSLCEIYTHVLLHLEGHTEAALEGMRAAVQQRKGCSPHYMGRLVFGVCYLQALASHWSESFQAAGHIVDLSRSNEVPFAEAWAVYMQGNAALQMLELDDADHCFSLAFAQRYIKNPRAALDSMVGHALCLQLQGREEVADECLREAREFAYWTGDPSKLDFVDSGRARVALLRGDMDRAARWEEAHHGKRDVLVKTFYLEYPEITACRVLVAKGTPKSLSKAYVRLNRLAKENRRFHHTCHLVPVLIMKSVLAFKRNRRQNALNLLAEAVDLSWPGCWILPFIEGGDPVAELLAELPENRAWGGFVPLLLSRIQSFLHASAKAEERELLTALTNRETDVIELLCERLYDKEIAEKLGISTATVKTHLTRAYSKLGVANRREAVAKAKHLSLV